ncbi:hypothetical protein DGWBC_1751 [Dehalogenimonas sp. WBC-2]|nr:hypothetical protein DGWBC_1751 [Dehalogenimonas sp. WBC-2]
MSKKILVVYQSFGGNTKALAEAAAEGAKSAGASIEIKDAANAEAADLANINGLILATTQPFQSMAGETKSFFERLWMGRDNVKKGTALGVIITHKNDPKPTEDSIKTIATYLGMDASQWLEVAFDDVEAGKDRARQLGIAIAQGG